MLVAAVVEGFAAYALAMHPESLCRRPEQADRRDAAGRTQVLPFPGTRRTGSRPTRQGK